MLEVISQIYQTIIYFLNLTFTTNAIWIIIPLVLTTFILMIYFGIYKEEKADWSTNFSNSLVLIFVSISLFQYIYTLDESCAFNFINELPKTLITLALLSVGLFLVKFNFEHLLPIKYARYISSPITINLVAYAIILLVYSPKPITWISIVSLIIIVLVLMGLLILIRIPMKKLRADIEKEKTRERLSNIKEEKYEIAELKKQLSEREKELNVIEFKHLEKERKEAIKLEKALKRKK